MTPYTHFTDEELVRQLLVRDDLTSMEHELLDRLIRALDALADYQGCKGSEQHGKVFYALGPHGEG